MEIIAERDKRHGKIIMVLGGIVTALSAFVLSVSFWYIVAFVFGVAFLAYGVYAVFCLPQEALVKDGDDLIVLYAFRRKRIAFNKIEYVSYNELGEFGTREGGLFTTMYVLNNDIRRLIITIKESGTLKHLYLWGILHASAVAVAINAMVDKAKKVDE